MGFSVRATVVQTPTPEKLDVGDDRLLTVDDGGTIVSIEPAADRAADDRPADVVLDDDTVLIPGLVDTHAHAPQWPQLGTGLDLPLDRWLQEYTFPLERRYDDHGFAREVWDDLVPTLLAHGTTTVAYFGTVDVGATTLLAEACARHGQRALVGRVAMDHPDTTPPDYRDPDPDTAVARSRRSIEEIRGIGSPLVAPIVTPRFIPACTDAALHGLGALARETGTTVQTHCSESDWEHHHVIDRTGRSDTAALDAFGLLRDHTVLAHSVHVDDDDLERIATAGAGIAHCPLSNIHFADAVFPFHRAAAHGVRIGLGTDIAGGPSPSLLAQCGHAVAESRRLRDGVDPALPRDERGTDSPAIDLVTAFHAATRGGAELLGLPVGALEPGRPFDAVAIRTPAAGPDVPADLDDPLRRFERIVRLSGPADIEGAWVAGRRVG